VPLSRSYTDSGIYQAIDDFSKDIPPSAPLLLLCNNSSGRHWPVHDTLKTASKESLMNTAPDTTASSSFKLDEHLPIWMTDPAWKTQIPEPESTLGESD